MARKFTSWDDLETALQNEMYYAMEEAVDQSFQDLHENVDYFYESPEGAYKRTGQLAESPEHELSGSGNNLVGKIDLDTTYRYNPSGRDTETIYGYAENNELLGNGGFWDKTMNQIEENIRNAFTKRGFQ